jgi:hypothetical protein
MRSAVTSEWPEYYPGDIPPPEAKNASGTAFRLVKSIPPQATDFRSTYEEDIQRNGRPRTTKSPSLYGTSLHLNAKASAATRERFPPLRGRRIACGTLDPSHGRMSEVDASAHFTVWFRAAATPHLAFTVDAETPT